MAKKSNNKLIGVALLVIGVGLAIWGYQLSGSVSSQITKAFSGSYGNKIMFMYIGGAVSAIVGFVMLMGK